MEITSPAQMRAVERLIRRGPATLILVYSPTCPHCHTYMPIWDELTHTEGRRANLLKMRADTYSQTPMSAAKQVEGVPTVLLVDKSGRITEVEQPRDVTKMKNIVKQDASYLRSVASEMPETRPSSPTLTPPPPPAVAAIPGTTVSENPLPPLPGTLSQSGGAATPWSAFLTALLESRNGTASLTVKFNGKKPMRSSGLPPARKTRRRSPSTKVTA